MTRARKPPGQTKAEALLRLIAVVQQQIGTAGLEQWLVQERRDRTARSRAARAATRAARAEHQAAQLDLGLTDAA